MIAVVSSIQKPCGYGMNSHSGLFVPATSVIRRRTQISRGIVAMETSPHRTTANSLVDRQRKVSYRRRVTILQHATALGIDRCEALAKILEDAAGLDNWAN